MPLSTGSMMLANTMGMDRVCRCNSYTIVVTFACTTSGFDPTSSATAARIRSMPPPAIQRYSHPKVAPFRPAETAQALRQSRDAGLRFRIVLGEAHQDANPPQPLTRLRPRQEWPCRRTSEQRDKRALRRSARAPPGIFA
jgi:hypothetical protein